MSKPNKHELYIRKLKEAWGEEFICLDEYQSSKVSINHLHVPCGTIKPMRPDHLLGKGKNRRGCRKCNNIRKTHEQFVEEIKAIHGDEIEVIGRYTNGHERIAIIHKTCGEVRTPFATNLLQGYIGCRECSLKSMWEKNTIEQKEFEHKIMVIHNGDVIPLGEYTGHRGEMEFLHVSCGRTWVSQAGIVLKGHSCNKCAIEAKRLSDDEVKQRLYDIYQDEIVWISGVYETYKSVLTFKNTKCNHEFDRTLEGMVNPVKRMVNNCPRCGGCSKGEFNIENFLIKIGANYKAEYRFDDCRNKNSLPFDFVLIGEDNLVKIAIEFDGQEHFEPIEYFGGEEKFLQRVRNDAIKDDYCKKNDIKLIRIPYWEINNIEKILERELGLVTI